MSAVIMGVVMMSLAIESDSGLVVDDYYKKGKQINRVIARDNMATSMSLRASIDLIPETSTVNVNIISDNWPDSDEMITLGLYHSTRPGMDQVLSLRKINSRLYSTRYSALAPGRWKIQLATDSWRLVGSLHRPGGNNVQLAAFSSR